MEHNIGGAVKAAALGIYAIPLPARDRILAPPVFTLCSPSSFLSIPFNTFKYVYTFRNRIHYIFVFVMLPIEMDAKALCK